MSESKYRALLVEFVDLLSKRDMPGELALLGLSNRIEAALAEPPAQAEPAGEREEAVAFETEFEGYKAFVRDNKASVIAGRQVLQPSNMFRVWLHFRAQAAQVAEPVGIGHCRKCDYSGPNAIHKRPKDGIKCDYMVALYPPAAQDVDKEILDNYAQMFEREHAQCQELVEALELIAWSNNTQWQADKARAALAKYKEKV